MNHKQQSILVIAQELLKQGWRVFIASSGNYMAYTDKEGTKVISISVEFFAVNASGNYISPKGSGCGSGWRITDNFDVSQAEEVFRSCAPYWATGNYPCPMTTLAEYLKLY